jgi:perosamine synthetase
MKIKFPVYRPSLSGKEKEYVDECLDSSWISSRGKFVEKFENEFAQYVGAKHATAVNSGTAALHLAMLALGIGPGDEVIVPTLTYVASVNAIAYVGATPVFVDSLRSTWQMDPEDVSRKLTNRTRAIMVVHLYGHVCDMDSLLGIARGHRLHLIEDCAEAFGSIYKNRHVGVFGDISAFSFFGNKTITTGEGGMVVTNESDLLDRVIHFKGQGLAKNREYWHNVIGYNYRMTNICAAIGLAQLEQANYFLQKKKQIAAWYKEFLRDLPVTFQSPKPEVIPSYWMVSILVKNSVVRDLLRDFLLLRGIETRPLFPPVHSMPIYPSPEKKFPVAQELSSRGLNLPSYPDLSEGDVKTISSHVREFLCSAKSEDV